jgi:hypothetical protein
MPSTKSRSPSNSVRTLSGVVIDAGTSALYLGSCAQTEANVDNNSKALAAVLNWVPLMFMVLLFLGSRFKPAGSTKGKALRIIKSPSDVFHLYRSALTAIAYNPIDSIT